MGDLWKHQAPTSKHQRSTNDQIPNSVSPPRIWCLALEVSLELGAWNLELMKFCTLIRRSLRFHWRSHLGVVLGAAIGSAALIGALVVGDSVKGSLRERNLERLGHGAWLLFSADRSFNENFPARVRCEANVMAIRGAANLYQKTSTQLPICINPNLPERSMLFLNGTVARQDASRRLNQTQIIGISDFSPVLFSAAETLLRTTPSRISLTNSVIVNETLAARLGVRVGDELLLRFAKPSLMSADTAIAPKDQSAATLRLSIQVIATNGEIANFSPVPGISPPATVFVPLGVLAKAAGLQEIREYSYTVGEDGDPGEDNLTAAKSERRTERVEINQINAWLSPEVVQLKSTQLSRSFPFQETIRRIVGWARNILGFKSSETDTRVLSLPVEKQAHVLNELLAKSLDFESVQIANLKAGSNHILLATPRVFLDPPLVRAAFQINSNAQPILTYLATLLRTGTNATPYSMVTAAGAPWTQVDLRDDEIVVSQWLAEDLQVKPGDEIDLSYFLPESGTRLEEATNRFRVHSIVPLEMPWADRTLMPDFPGIEKAESTSEWDAGFPLIYEIRKKDDDYWKQHRGTPKAFITLAAGQKLWGNRFGNLTAIRFPIPANSSATNYQAELERKILANLKPEELGLRFEPVREQALKAARESQDFGGLFLGFSFFLIIAALLLMAMLFQFGLEQRASEIGTLLALGFTPKQVRKVFLREGAALAFIGGIIGAVGGIYFAKAMLQGLATVWRDAVGATSLSYHVTGQTLVIGLVASVVVSTLTLWLALRRFVKLSPRELLVGEIQSETSNVQRPTSNIVAVVAAVLGLGLVGWAVFRGETQNAGIFFGAGALVLVAGLSFVSAWLMKLNGAPNSNSARSQRATTRADLEFGASFTAIALAVRSCARRRKRSLATVAMLACGSFLIVSIGVFRLDANRDATQKTSGTGGFALLGETTLPVVQDLNSVSGRDFFTLNEQDLNGVTVVPFRVRQGDEASCLNLNRAQKPRLLGVKPEALDGRFGFAKGGGWQALRGFAPEGEAHVNPQGGQPRSHERSHEIAAIGDANSIQWAMGKKVGDTIDYVDERGQPFKVRIVGAVANSILQGQLLIDEAEFVKRFPSEAGYRMFLIDAPSNAVSQVSATLSRAMQDVGLELTPTVVRLNQFNAVQNTYLGTFQVLGGLGLLLGSVGLGIVVLRNVLERRSELAVLLAVGFRKSQVQRLLLVENGALLLAGLATGVVAAAIAVLPALLSPTGQFPAVTLALTLGAVLLNGAVWTWAATRYAVRGDLLAALRND
jgi:putative ABC transport system permease protein